MMGRARLSAGAARRVEEAQLLSTKIEEATFRRDVAKRLTHETRAAGNLSEAIDHERLERHWQGVLDGLLAGAAQREQDPPTRVHMLRPGDPVVAICGARAGVTPGAAVTSEMGLARARKRGEACLRCTGEEPIPTYEEEVEAT